MRHLPVTAEFEYVAAVQNLYTVSGTYVTSGTFTECAWQVSPAVVRYRPFLDSVSASDYRPAVDD